MKNITIVTHDGTFHADDVFACATLSLLLEKEEIEIVRSRDQEVIDDADYVLDVGGIYDVSTNRFDHHQIGGASKRDNGIPYASFGLVWKEFGEKICQSKEAMESIDERLVQSIDAYDNGYQSSNSKEVPVVYSVGEIISSFRCTWQEEDLANDEFMEALNFATTVLHRLIIQTKSFIEGKSLIEKAYTEAEDKRVIFLDQEYPGWNKILNSYSEPLYIIYQRSNHTWGAKAVRVNEESFELRKPFPEAWAGLRDEKLTEVSTVSDAVFCHNNLFMVVAKSKESIVKLVQLALEY